MINDLRHSFPGQETNEPVFVFARPFFIAFLPTAAIFFILMLVSFLAQAYVSTTSFFANFGPNFNEFAVIFLGVFELFGLLVFLVAILDFYFDLLIVTDRRLVDIDQEQLFYRRVSELSLEEIEDVTSEIKGFLPTIFNYGTVIVETAGARTDFVINNIRNPREVSVIILDLKAQAKANVPEGDRHPDGNVMGVINQQLMHSTADLQAAGALLPEEVRRFGNAVS
jgi:hypothetical protein